MNKEEIQMISFEVVAFAGEARSKLMEALNEAEKNNLDSSKQLIKEAEASLLEAHKSQAALLAAETKGEGAEVSFILVHAQDHLMTTMLLKDMMQHLLNIYKKNRI